MNIRNYTQKEEQAVVDLWNRALPFDGIDVSKFRRQAILDENFNPELAFVAEERADQQVSSLEQSVGSPIWNGGWNLTEDGSTSSSWIRIISAGELAAVF